MKTLGEYLRGIRRDKDIHYEEVAEYISERCSKYSVSTLKDYINGFERGLRHLDDASNQEEPTRSIFCMYLQRINLDSEEITEVKSFLGDDFNLSPDSQLECILIE